MKARLFEIVSDSDKLSIDKVCEVLNSNPAIKDWAYILHDKDETRSHFHVSFRLRDSYDSKYVSEWFGVAENFVNRVKGRWSDMLKYLIHENAPDKYQYSIDEVVSNFDWVNAKDKDESNKRLDIIVAGIENGLIREYNYFNHITMVEYTKYNRQIDKAFSYRKDKIKGVNRDMEAVFITGDSGVGKTTYAKMIADEKGYSVFVSSGSNDPFDDYKGEDCIVLDDLRPSTLHLADLLKILDNNTASSVKSRYKNKVLECKMIIITTTLDIDTFFNNVFSDEIETAIQLKRRCRTHVRMTKDKIFTKMWQGESRMYSKEFEFPNPVNYANRTKDMTDEEILNELSRILGVGKDMVEEVKNNKKEYIQVDIDDVHNPFK